MAFDQIKLVQNKNIPEKACVNTFHNNYAFVNVVHLHTRKTFEV